MDAASGQVPAALAAALADRYRLERVLGAGGMATVYLAEDLKHHRRVALKVLRPDLAATLGADRFLREVTIAAGLQHPHVLPLHDSGEAGGFLFYVMPFVDGQSLRDRLGREGELPVYEAVRVLRDVADALAYSHKHGVVHRDIKPENVMLSGRHAVVTDFGVAKAVSEATGRQQLTTIGVALGTPAYMSPEQATADPHVDHRADIYALGAMGYELLTGRPPFIGGSPQQVLAAHVTETAEPVTKHRASIPAPLAELIARCLEKKPADRPQSAEELVPQLEALLTPSGGMTPTAAHPGAVQRHSWRGARRWIALGAVVLATLAVPHLNRVRHAGTAAGARRTTVAVLPFANEGVDSAHAYLLGGMHEELLTQLAKVPALTVISRRSVLGYKGTNTPLRTIARELQVGSVVEGSIQVVGNRLRVNLQLIDAATDAHLWAEHYDRSLDDAFAIESDVARRVAGAVGAVLSTPQSRHLATAPTANPEAYRFHLKAREYYSRGLGDPSILLAAQLFDSAVVRDPKFALAWAELAKAHARAYMQGYDITPARVASARRAVEEAVRLAPGTPETQEAKAWFAYWIGRDYARAASEFASAVELGAKSADVHVGLGVSERRLGKWDDAMAALLRAQALDPRSSEIAIEVGISHFYARRYSDAIVAFRQAIALAPDQHRPYGYLASALIASGRTQDSAIVLLRQGAALIGDAAFVNRSFDGNATTAVNWMLPAVFPDAFPRLSRQDLGPRLAEYYLGLAEWHWQHGRLGQQRAYGDSAVALVPTSPRALALAGRANDANKRLASYLKEEARFGDHRTWPQRVYWAARIFAVIGENRRAIELLEDWAPMPSEGSAGMVQLDPAFKALRREPRFLAVVAAARAQ